MCNVIVRIPKISIKKIERLLNRRSFKAKTISINKLIELEKELIFPDGSDFGRISIESLKYLIHLKNFYREKEIPIRELEAIKDGWKINSDGNWAKESGDFYLFLDYPGIKINTENKEKLQNILLFLKEVLKEGQRKKVDSRIAELIQEFYQLENIFYCCPNIKIFEDKKDYFQGETPCLSSSCLQAFRKKIEKKMFFSLSDYLFLKQLISKAIDCVNHILGTESIAFEKALQDLSKYVAVKQ